MAQSVVAAPAGKRFLALLADGGGQASLIATVRRMTLGHVLDVGLLLVVVAVMVVRPAL